MPAKTVGNDWLTLKASTAEKFCKVQIAIESRRSLSGEKRVSGVWHGLIAESLCFRRIYSTVLSGESFPPETLLDGGRGELLA